MAKHPSERESPFLNATDDGTRVVYVIQSDAADQGALGLIDIAGILWWFKWRILLVSLVFFIGGIIYVSVADRWYSSSVLLSPAAQGEQRGLLERQLTGLGGLIGIDGIRMSGVQTTEALATMRSREFTRDFIEEMELAPILVESEGEEVGIGDKADSRDVRDLVKFFDERIRTVTQDTDTGLVTVTIEWKDPDMAASWADNLVQRLNVHMRERVLRETQSNIEFLTEQLTATNVTSLRETLGNLMESELQHLMLARGNEEFAFRVIDGAQIPKDPIRPRVVLTPLLSLLLGLVLSVVIVLLGETLRSTKQVSIQD